MKNDDSLKLREKYHIMEDWFVPILDQLEKVKLDKYPDIIFWVNENNKEIYMKYNKKAKELYVNNDRIWSYFKSNYSHNYMEIRKLIQGLVGEHLNLWGITPWSWYFRKKLWVGEHLNLWGITPWIWASTGKV